MSQVKASTQKVVADVVTWSMRWAMDGVHPDVGFKGEKLCDSRDALRGKPIAGEFRFAYFGFKSDLKARKECHYLERSYQHNLICETCFAQRPNKHGDPQMYFKDFSPGAAHLMTHLTHEEYVRSSSQASPWLHMPGFNIKSCFRDPMHVVFLGTAKDLLASCLGYWNRVGLLPGANLAERLRTFSKLQRDTCKAAGLQGPYKTYTPANTHLDTPSEFAELGSSFKAASIKTCIWFFAKYAMELTSDEACMLPFRLSNTAQDFNVHLISVCLWSLQQALEILDYSDLVVTAEDAKASGAITIKVSMKASHAY